MTWQLGPHPDDAARAAAAAPGGTGSSGTGAGTGPGLGAGEADPSGPSDATPSVPHLPTRPQLRRPTLVLRPRADTRDAVVLELLPLLAPALAIGATQLLLPWSTLLLAACLAVTSLAQLVVASRDAALLRSRGFVGTAPSALALVSPILYLAVRGRVCSQHDRTAYAPVPWAIGSTVVAIGALALTAWLEGSVDASLGGMLTGLF
ncbi:hypothetical protein [Schumannella sp. 10F1B-5-1]|uniref:hypothetical protein n=1 Tax=Schumannella sp. 10F1B-5-1 TaxID=2590780 RepID=UPI001130CA8F|nr:hypothetical protein [Schumannella sp. 10F1B-5-1]TPW71547.1 hypothetical protein FJ658_09275 [Schumannella sp. 10F1B-5-1]